MALTSGSAWHWQMEMDHEDQTYELFWKQVLRWLVNTSPDPVMINSDKDTYLPAEPVRIYAEISNKKFERMNNAKVIAKVTNPDGITETIPLDWNGSQDGTYQTELNAGGPGIYRVEVEAAQGNENLGTNRAAFQVQDRPVEFYNAALDTRLLQGIASSTDGHYYPLVRIVDVPDEKGQIVHWQAELGGRTVLTKQYGWTRNTLKFGDKVTIVGRRVKSGAPYINLTDRASIVLVDQIPARVVKSQ